MKLLFLTLSTLRFTVETPAREPLGGTESAAAYLTQALAARGHDVTLMTQLPPGTPPVVAGVRHVPPPSVQDAPAFFAQQDFDAVMTLSYPGAAHSMKQVAPRALQVAWLHMLPDQPAMAPLAAATPYIDVAVFVSQSQRAAVPFAGPAHVIGNGIAPAFENLFASAEDLLAAKKNRAAYASTPFRGLDVLVDAWRKADIATELDVYSAMRMYQMPDTQFTALYDSIAATPRCRYHGAVSQPALAQALKPASFLAYPSTFAETYCIAALEAIVAGLQVVATDLGALRESTMGYATLMTLPPGMRRNDMAAPFAKLLEETQAAFLADKRGWAEARFAQSREVNRVCNWAARAKEWEDFLAPAIAAKRGTAS